MKQVFVFLLILTLSISLGCSQRTPTPTPTASPSPTSPPTPTQTPTPTAAALSAAVTQEDIDAAREVVFQYWDAYNSYDVERVLSYLEETYREEREGDIKSEIGQMRLFRVKLGVEEGSEPVITPEGNVEIRIKLSTPIGARHLTYHLAKVDGDWKIYLAEEH